MTGDEPWAISFEPRAERDLRRLDRQVARRVLAALDRLLVRDPSLDVRRLTGSDEWRLRVGDWRVRLRLDFDERVVLCAFFPGGELTSADLCRRGRRAWAVVLLVAAGAESMVARVFCRCSCGWGVEVVALVEVVEEPGMGRLPVQ